MSSSPNWRGSDENANPTDIQFVFDPVLAAEYEEQVAAEAAAACQKATSKKNAVPKQSIENLLNPATPISQPALSSKISAKSSTVSAGLSSTKAAKLSSSKLPIDSNLTQLTEDRRQRTREKAITLLEEGQALKLALHRMRTRYLDFAVDDTATMEANQASLRMYHQETWLLRSRQREFVVRVKAFVLNDEVDAEPWKEMMAELADMEMEVTEAGDVAAALCLSLAQCDGGDQGGEEKVRPPSVAGMKAEYDTLVHQMPELAERFRHCNFDAGISLAENRANVTMMLMKLQNLVRRVRQWEEDVKSNRSSLLKEKASADWQYWRRKGATLEFALGELKKAVIAAKTRLNEQQEGGQYLKLGEKKASPSPPPARAVTHRAQSSSPMSGVSKEWNSGSPEDLALTPPPAELVSRRDKQKQLSTRRPDAGKFLELFDDCDEPPGLEYDSDAASLGSEKILSGIEEDDNPPFQLTTSSFARCNDVPERGRLKTRALPPLLPKPADAGFGAAAGGVNRGLSADTKQMAFDAIRQLQKDRSPAPSPSPGRADGGAYLKTSEKFVSEWGGDVDVEEQMEIMRAIEAERAEGLDGKENEGMRLNGGEMDGLQFSELKIYYKKLDLLPKRQVPALPSAEGKGRKSGKPRPKEGWRTGE